MKTKPIAVATVLAVTALIGTTAMAATESVIYSFPYYAEPRTQLLEDPSGALFGAAYYGDNRYGSVYELSEKAGVWSERTIYDFSGNDGENPSSGLIEDSDGVLYGATFRGGPGGGGTVFSLSPEGSSWTEAVLHGFGGSSDGANPKGKLLRDKATGILYGTTSAGGGEAGGNTSCGTVFDIVESGGEWTKNTLHTFQGGTDGCAPITGVQPGVKDGTLFGTTSHGGQGRGGGGTVFKLTETEGSWTESVLYRFTGGSDGGAPSDFVVSSDGTIYGVAVDGGTYGQGVVFELSIAHGKWQESVLHSFQVSSHRSLPKGIRLDKTTGILYGTTEFGGGKGVRGEGAAFALTPSGSTWTYSILHSFRGSGDGANPTSRMISDPTTGVLYGTTDKGGDGGGTVFVITN